MTTKLIRPGPDTSRSEVIGEVAQMLRGGRLVALPTETVYGLGANAFDERAVGKIYAVKGRPSDNPMIVHVASLAMAAELMQSVPPHFNVLAEAFWPGPLTMVVRRHAVVPDVVTAGLDTVALRMPAHPLTLACIKRAGVPVAAPSANLSGRPSPTSAAMVWEELRGRIPLILDGGACRIGIESTVLDLTRGTPVILRPGSITREDISRVIGRPVRLHRGGSSRPSSPGMKYLHYAPASPLVLLRTDPGAIDAAIARVISRYLTHGARVGLMAPARLRRSGAHAFVSLGQGTAIEYARGIYRAMRELDALGVDVILCAGLPEEGLGLAVMNRLRLAATKTVRVRR
jgi:L-threonylcarbamoyladenylate synthase